MPYLLAIPQYKIILQKITLCVIIIAQYSNYGGTPNERRSKGHKRAKRTTEQRTQDQIDKIDAKIAELQKKKEELLKPLKAKELIEKAAASMSIEELAEKLGIDI